LKNKGIQSNKSHILIAGQFPPPVTGFAFITQEIARVIGGHHETTIIDLSPHRKRGGASYHLHRSFLTLRGVWTLVRHAIKNKSRIFYVAGEGKLGLLYNITLSSVARSLGYRIYLHHHNFNYIDSFSKLMAVLVFVIGKKATHIFLCQTMADLFIARYGPVKFEILSNSAFVEPAPAVSSPTAKTDAEPLVIGLLSNLNNAKGLGLFLDLLRQAVRENLNIIGILAGPPDGEAERAAIETARLELGTKLDYRGPVYGEAKNDFFRRIDVFVFPTCYANEAQPTVVYEAFASGVPVVSYDRGCILSQVGKCGAVQRRNEDFVSFALSWLKETLANPDFLFQLKLEARASFLEDRKLSKEKAQTLFE